MTLDPSQQIALITAILSADLTVAAILFGVLGFIYAVYASFATPHLPEAPIKELRMPVFPHPILDPLARVARWILFGLGLATVIAIGCSIWFLIPRNGLLIGIAGGLLLEVILLFGIGAFVVFALMPRRAVS